MPITYIFWERKYILVIENVLFIYSDTHHALGGQSSVMIVFVNTGIDDVYS